MRFTRQRTVNEVESQDNDQRGEFVLTVENSINDVTVSQQWLRSPGRWMGDD